MKVSFKWGYTTTRHIMFWLVLAAAVGRYFAKGSFSDSHKEFVDWLATDFNWMVSIALLCVVPIIYLFWAADRIHMEYVSGAEARKAELESKVATYEERDRPKLTVSFSKGISGCSATNHNGLRYFRLLVMLDYFQGITGCSGVLTCVERESDGKILMNHESIPLPFVPSHEPDTTNKTLMPARPFFLDVLVVHEFSQQLQNPGPGKVYLLKDNQGNLVFDKPDTYLLTVNLAGVGIPTQIVKVRFEWTGDYNTVAYSIV